MNCYLKLLSSSVLCFVAFSSVAEAATRTICMNLEFRDVREDAPDYGDTGSRRGIHPTGGYSDAVGHRVELWDKDGSSSSSDEFIAVATLNSEGTNCFSFEWENAPYSKGESDPDIYIRYINEVRHTTCTSCAVVTGITDSGSPHPDTSWRNTTVVNNCTGTCSFPNTLYISSTPTTTRAKVVMALDSSQHALQIWGQDLNEDIEMEAPTGGSSSLAKNQHLFEIRDARCINGFSPPHELGHLLQMQQFNQNYLKNDCGRGGSGHGFTSLEHESCATTEGWADYAGVVAWYSPANTSVVPLARGKNLEGPFTVDTTNCADAAHMEFTVARAFWDLDDANNENSTLPGLLDDDSNYSSMYLASQWDRFSDGVFNRDDYEIDKDGVNMRDYMENSLLNTAADETALFHSCLINHDFN